MHSPDGTTESHAEVGDGERELTSGQQTVGLHGIRGERGEPAECARSDAQHGEGMAQWTPPTDEQASQQCGTGQIDGQGGQGPLLRPDGGY